MKKLLAIVMLGILVGGYLFWPSSSREYNLILITIDTLRADRLGCYGYQKAKTPTIDRLAREGVLFEHAYCHSPLTLPSHGSILSGTLPSTHGVRDNLFFEFPDHIPTLASILHHYRYQTAAAVSAATLAREKGLARGFTEYDDAFSHQPANEKQYIAERVAKKTVARAVQQVERLAKNSKIPFFYWLHLFDPHAEYVPPAEYRKEFEHPYDGEIAYTDACLREFMQKLEQLQLADNTIIVLTSDHGEGLGEHNEQSHGYFLYNSTLQVPLIIKAPDIFPAGKRVRRNVRSIDIMPTVLALLGVAEKGQAQGVDISPWVISSQPPPENRVLSSYAETFYPYHVFGWQMLRSITRQEYKYIATQEGELYNIAQDPGEQHNLLLAESGVSSYQDKIRTFQRQLSAIEENRGLLAPSQFGGDESVRSIGYSGESASLEGRFDGPCPSKMVDCLVKVNRAQTLIWYQQYQEAGKLLQQVLGKDPNNIMALKLMGKIYREQGELAKAQQTFSKLFKLRPTMPVARNALVDVHILQENFPQAHGIIQQAIELQRDDAFIWSRLAYLQLQQKRYSEAVNAAQKAIELDRSLPSSWYYLALAWENQTQSAKAAQAYYQYAWLLAEQEKASQALSILAKAKQIANPSMAVWKKIVTLQQQIQQH